MINLLPDEAKRLVANSLFIDDISGKTSGYLIGNKFGLLAVSIGVGTVII